MKALFFIIIFFSILNLNNFVKANEKIVYLNVNYVFNKSISGTEANKSIEKKIKDLEGKVSQFRKNIDIKKEKLITQKNILSENDFNKKFNEIENEIKTFNKKIKEQNDNINNLRNEIRLNFTKELIKVLNDYSTKNSIEMIIKQEDILLGSKKLDISNDILKIIDESKINLIK